MIKFLKWRFFRPYPQDQFLDSAYDLDKLIAQHEKLGLRRERIVEELFDMAEHLAKITKSEDLEDTACFQWLPGWCELDPIPCGTPTSGCRYVARTQP